jgi:hypothetical protein
MTRYHLIIFSFFVFSIPVLSQAQMIDSMMKVYADNYPQEKIYLQFDKNIYNPGETIWFKAYLFSGTDPSVISKNFYAELSDGEGNVLQKKTAPLFEATASGSFDIPVSTKSSHLHIRAFTDWMLNFDTVFLFEKDIRLAGLLKDSGSHVVTMNKVKDSLRNPAVQVPFFQFFPEGGDIITGIENNIAFKATDQFGVPINIQASLKDAAGKDILEFNSQHDGMGKFLLTPDKGDQFYAVWKDARGTEHRTDLPQIKTSGVVLRLMNAKKKVFFSIARSQENADQLSHLTIMAHMNQQLLYKATVDLHENFMSGGSIPTDQLPTGILQVTVFNNDMPLAERVIFVNNHEYEFSADLEVPSKSLKKRGKNIIEIRIPDTLRSNFSLAVTDGEADGEKPNEDNIISRLLLTGDVRGFVYHPYYYFSTAADSVAQFLDLVMLTNGWRRFNWAWLARKKLPIIKYPVQDYLSLKVEVLGVDPLRIAKDEEINIFLHQKDSSTQIMQVPRLSGPGGKFGITGLIFYDTAKAFYQFNKNRNLSSEAAVVFTNGLFNSYRKVKPLTLAFDVWTPADSSVLKRNDLFSEEARHNRALPDNGIKTLEAVTVKGRQKSAAEKLDEEYTSGLFTSSDAYVFDLADDPTLIGYPDIFTFLQARVPGLQISTTGTGVTLQWRGGRPTLYLNEIQTDASQLRDIPVRDIALVKVFRPGTMVGSGGGGGSIAVYLKKGSSKNDDPSFKGLDRSPVIGYAPVRQFFSPDYEKNPELNSTSGDARITLYWNPNILFDKTSLKSTIQFFNNDVTRQFRIVLEGINEEGKLVRIEKIIQ